MLAARRFFAMCVATTLLVCLAAMALNLAMDPARARSWNVSTERTISELLNAGKIVLLDDYFEERLLQKWRLESPRARADASTVVLGSSRVLSLGLPIGLPGVLNLGVSNASLEDIIALADLALERGDGKRVLIGVDPWMFSEISGHDQWVALKPEYEAAVLKLEGGHAEQHAATRPSLLGVIKNNLALHRTVYSMKSLAVQLGGNDGITPLPSTDRLPAPRGDKLLPDGSRVLGLGSRIRDPADQVRDDRRWEAYGMKKFRYSSAKWQLFTSAVTAIGKGRPVLLWLAPYRPSTYELLERNGAAVSDIEARVRAFAQASGAVVVGSYDPAKASCSGGEFHDGAHPLPSCVARQFTGAVLVESGLGGRSGLDPLY